MGIRQQDICNRVMAQAQGIAESDFPIDAFPAKVQCVILGMVRHENFKVEYLPQPCCRLRLPRWAIPTISV